MRCWSPVFCSAGTVEKGGGESPRQAVLNAFLTKGNVSPPLSAERGVEGRRKKKAQRSGKRTWPRSCVPFPEKEKGGLEPRECGWPWPNQPVKRRASPYPAHKREEEKRGDAVQGALPLCVFFGSESKRRDSRSMFSVPCVGTGKEEGKKKKRRADAANISLKVKEGPGNASYRFGLERKKKKEKKNNSDRAISSTGPAFVEGGFGQSLPIPILPQGGEGKKKMPTPLKEGEEEGRCPSSGQKRQKAFLLPGKRKKKRGKRKGCSARLPSPPKRERKDRSTSPIQPPCPDKGKGKKKKRAPAGPSPLAAANAGIYVKERRGRTSRFWTCVLNSIIEGGGEREEKRGSPATPCSFQKGGR